MNRLKPKKSLGQHFLRSKEALANIIGAADIIPGETVLEIGPGEGALTGALLHAGAHIIAVEADPRAIKELNERFTEAIRVRHLIILEGDVREERVAKALFQKKFLDHTPYKLVANIPYYLTGMLFRLFLEKLRQPSRLVFLVQKEVAEQAVARDDKEGVLSLSIKAYGTPRMIAKVGREAFSPPPKVDSAIVAIDDISRMRLGSLRDKDYFRVVKAGLGAKRKMLMGNLSRGLNIPKDKLSLIFQNIDIDANMRGEDLSSAKWIALAQEIKKMNWI